MQKRENDLKTMVYKTDSVLPMTDEYIEQHADLFRKSFILQNLFTFEEFIYCSWLKDSNRLN